MTWCLPLLMLFAFPLPASQPAADQELLLQQLAVIAWSLHGVCGLITAKIASSKGRNPAVSFVKVRAHSRCCLHVVPVSHPLSRSKWGSAFVISTHASCRQCHVQALCRQLQLLRTGMETGHEAPVACACKLSAQLLIWLPCVCCRVCCLAACMCLRSWCCRQRTDSLSGAQQQTHLLAGADIYASTV